VPEAMFVSAHAASNFEKGKEKQQAMKIFESCKRCYHCVQLPKDAIPVTCYCHLVARSI